MNIAPMCLAVMSGLPLVALLLATGSPALSGETPDGSCAAICRDHPERVKKLFAALDLDRPGLEKVRAAAGKEDWPAACEALVAYYRDGKTADWLRVAAPAPGDKRVPPADAILDDTFTIQAVTAKQPRRKDGGLDWSHTGPNRDNEWAWLLNRHDCFVQLLGAWRRTGNPEYARGFDRIVRDWVVSNQYGKGHAWRSLETGLRMRAAWPRAFYGFQASGEFTPAARILMLSSIPDHADTCVNRHGGGNWFLMEMMGLANAATCWPEFRDSAKWFDFAIKGITPEMKRQVCPDGVHREMSAGYHHVAAANFGPMVDLARKAGRDMPGDYLRGVEKLWDYLAYAMRPDGHNPLTADSDLDDYRARLRDAIATFKREDWKYITTNGKEGRKPADPPSRAWAYSGQMVMRSGWDGKAQWSYFDAGPCGGFHGHYDDLHLSVAAFGRDLLVDGGRYWYKGDRWREYFKGSAAHNVILVDGLGQNDSGRGTDLKGRHAIAPAFDFVSAEHATGFGAVKGVKHARAAVYLRGLCWVVFDRVTLDRPRSIEALWHFHPDCTVEARGLEAVSTDAGKGNLRIVPAGGPEWNLELVKGREKPSVQGWYSPTYNVKHPNATAVYSARLDKSAAFAWALVPAGGPVPAVKLEALPAPEGAARLRLALPEGKTVEVAVRFEGKAAVELGGGLKLEGDCAILGLDEKPLAAGGRILDVAGRTVAGEQEAK